MGNDTVTISGHLEKKPALAPPKENMISAKQRVQHAVMLRLEAIVLGCARSPRGNLHHFLILIKDQQL